MRLFVRNNHAYDKNQVKAISIELFKLLNFAKSSKLGEEMRLLSCSGEIMRNEKLSSSFYFFVDILVAAEVEAFFLFCF